MAISTNSKVRITLRAQNAQSILFNVWDYNVLELVGTPTAAHYAEAWWNHVKTDYRALIPNTWGNPLLSVTCLELGNPSGEYGEYAIPTAERSGTRTPPADADEQPGFMAIGVRLTVGTRLTRPGQKRFGWLTQSDVVGNNVQSPIISIVQTLMDTMTANMTLGAPAAGVVLVPNVVGLNADGTIRASQFVHGYVVNPYVTTQNSRKYGRGI